MYIKVKKQEYPIIIANTFCKRLKGLMGKTNITFGMLFFKCNSIHTFFMKENIDIIGLNEKQQIIYIYQNLPKNKIIKIKYPLKKTAILELPQNSTKNLKTGEIIKFY